MTRKQVVFLVLALCVIFFFVPVLVPHSWGFWGWSPLGVAIVVLVLVLVL